MSTLDLGRAGDIWYIAMELVRRLSAGALVREQALSPLALIEVGVQATAGLATSTASTEAACPSSTATSNRPTC